LATAVVGLRTKRSVDRQGAHLGAQDIAIEGVHLLVNARLTVALQDAAAARHEVVLALQEAATARAAFAAQGEKLDLALAHIAQLDSVLAMRSTDPPAKRATDTPAHGSPDAPEQKGEHVP
jgi:hypothetical protein